MKQYFKTQLLIQNLPEQEDHIKEEKFKRDYLLHSYLAAREKFKRDVELIKSGELLQDIEDSTCREVTIHAKLLFVQMEEGYEKEILVSTSDTDEPASHIVEVALEQGSINVQRELKKGHVRHPIPIKEVFSYRTETTEKLNGKPEEIHVENDNLENYGSVEETFQEMSYLHYSVIDRIKSYDPEQGENLHISKFLIKNDGDKEIKILLCDNHGEYTVSPALVQEIQDKFYIERNALRNYKNGPLFGKNEVIYEIEPGYRKHQRELNDPKVTFAVLVTFGDRNNLEFSEMIPYLYKDTDGKDLFAEEAKAFEFYRDRYYDHTEGHLSSKIASALGYGDYFIQKIQFTYYMDSEEHFHTLYQDNTLDFAPEYASRLKEIKEKRRDDLTKLNPHTEQDYVMFEDSLEILTGINKFYFVFKGDNWVRPEKERRFFHHDLPKARMAALDFYRQVKEEEFGSDLSQPVSLIIYASNLRDNPYYIASTDVKHQEYLEFGRQEERKFYKELGYRLSDLEDEGVIGGNDTTQ